MRIVELYTCSWRQHNSVNPSCIRGNHQNSIFDLYRNGLQRLACARSPGTGTGLHRKLCVVREADDALAVGGQKSILRIFELSTGMRAFVDINKCVLAPPHSE